MSTTQEALSAVLSEGFPEEDALKQMGVDDLIKMGVEIRDELTVERRKFDKFEADSKGMMARISMALKAKGDELGVNSFATREGTAYRQLKESYRIGDWNQFIPWIRETENFQCLEKRAAKLATKEIHQSTGQIPPGIEYVAEEEFVIRRPNEKGKRDE